jgi:hypothetical protein
MKTRLILTAGAAALLVACGPRPANPPPRAGEENKLAEVEPPAKADKQGPVVPANPENKPGMVLPPPNVEHRPEIVPPPPNVEHKPDIVRPPANVEPRSKVVRPPADVENKPGMVVPPPPGVRGSQ